MLERNSVECASMQMCDILKLAMMAVYRHGIKFALVVFANGCLRVNQISSFRKGVD